MHVYIMNFLNCVINYIDLDEKKISTEVTLTLYIPKESFDIPKESFIMMIREFNMWSHLLPRYHSFLSTS